MKVSRLFYAISILLCFLIYLSCRRMPDVSNERTIENRFFTIPSSTHSLVKTLSQRIFQQNQRYGFVNGLVQRVGFPKWDKAMIVVKNQQQTITGRSEGGSNATAVYIPFVKSNSNYTNSVLSIHMSSEDTIYKLVYAEEYANYGFDTTQADHWDARDIFHLFTLFDNTMFGHTEFQVNDGRIFGRDSSFKPKVILTDGPGQGCTNCSMMPLTVCNSYVVCGECNGFRSEGGENPCCHPQINTICTTYWIEIGGGGSGNGTGGQPGGGGPGGTGGPGGNNPGWWDEPCEEDPSGIGRIMPCDGIEGWFPIEEEVPGFNPYIADTIIIDTSISNNFSCFDSILRTVANANLIAQVILNNTFNLNVDVNLTFSIDWSINHPDSAEAYTDNPTSSMNSDTSGVQIYTNVIYFNPWILTHSSKEFLIATIYHEAIHAKIQFDFLRYRMQLIDSNYIKNHYSIFWNILTGNYIAVDPEHDIIAGEYINTIKLFTLQYYNLNAPQNIRDSVSYALAWGGLKESNVWRTKPDTCNIIAINLAAKDTTLIGPFNIPGTNCPIYQNINFASLYLTNSCN